MATTTPAASTEDVSIWNINDEQYQQQQEQEHWQQKQQQNLWNMNIIIATTAAWELATTTAAWELATTTTTASIT